jgi:hypothetical protein
MPESMGTRITEKWFPELLDARRPESFMNPRPGHNSRTTHEGRQSVQMRAPKHPMRSAGEFFAWLWGPSEAERARQRRQIRVHVADATASTAPGAAFTSQPVSRRQQIVEQRIEDGRIVLRRTVIEEIEIRGNTRQ